MISPVGLFIMPFHCTKLQGPALNHVQCWGPHQEKCCYWCLSIGNLTVARTAIISSLDWEHYRSSKRLKCGAVKCCHGADSRFAPSQWETALLCNAVSHWLGANLESALCQLILRRSSMASSDLLTGWCQDIETLSAWLTLWHHCNETWY